MSDYLRNAPENVMQSLAKTVFARIGGEDRTAYSEEVCDYLNSREFLEENQGLFLKRFRGISETARGESVDLLDCYRRLAERGLVEYDPDLVIRWNSIGDRSRKVGRSSVLMRTVVIDVRPVVVQTGPVVAAKHRVVVDDVPGHELADHVLGVLDVLEYVPDVEIVDVALGERVGEDDRPDALVGDEYPDDAHDLLRQEVGHVVGVLDVVRLAVPCGICRHSISDHLVFTPVNCPLSRG